ncbi:MAG: protein-L-isoaspartate(D-aspartate) O-methyltransferase [Parcubacteria group bacterium]|nr:protein-L-isoaspartate(D-aspartate) O-methyltransferase [Parcubacteria group bacterium]
MRTNQELVRELIRQGVLSTPRIIDAFRAVDRRFFVSKGLKRSAYKNEPLPIGEGQTISQPLTVAIMVALLAPKEGERVLEIGFGSGYQTAILARLVGDTGHVYALERIESLYEFGKKNLDRFGIFNVTLILADGSQGYQEYALYNGIIVDAAATAIEDSWKAQLTLGGRLVVPVGKTRDDQTLTKLTKVGEEKFKIEERPGFRFVPLIRGPTRI